MLYVWKRDDGYVDASTYHPRTYSSDTFDILLKTEDWEQARELIRAKRLEAGPPEWWDDRRYA